MRATRAIGSSSPTRPSLVWVLACCMFRLLYFVLACSLYSDLSVRRAVSRALCLGSVVSEGGTCLLWQVPLSRVPAHFPVAPRIRGRSFTLEYFTLVRLSGSPVRTVMDKKMHARHTGVPGHLAYM